LFEYFLFLNIAYLIGLMLAFVGLILMNSAQPALLYLCPLLLITSFLTALIRGELKIFWNGEPVSRCY
jgi:minor histocompatibility antigen H13